MKIIKRTAICTNTDGKEFHRVLSEHINDMQENGWEVEIQYQTSMFNNEQVVYSALILGRKEQ